MVASKRTNPTDQTDTVSTTNDVGTDIEISWDETELRNIGSIQDAIAVLETKGLEPVHAADVLGDGFSRMDAESKRKLVGNPAIFFKWDFRQSTEVTRNGEPSEYVTCLVIYATARGAHEKVRFSDGSDGIYKQLKGFTTRSGRTSGLMAPKGLRASDYIFTNEKGDKSPATTYYIDVDDM